MSNPIENELNVITEETEESTQCEPRVAVKVKSLKSVRTGVKAGDIFIGCCRGLPATSELKKRCDV